MWPFTKDSIFVSYDWDNDRRYKSLLVAWSKNARFNSFDFHDESADVGIQSEEAAVIKRAISAKIRRADYFLVIVGELTHTSMWVAWEIEKAKELGKRIVGIKLQRGHTSPPGLLRANVEWTLAFTEEGIRRAIEGASWRW